jgi:hypothetical protein
MLVSDKSNSKYKFNLQDPGFVFFLGVTILTKIPFKQQASLYLELQLPIYHDIALPTELSLPNNLKKSLQNNHHVKSRCF